VRFSVTDNDNEHKVNKERIMRYEVTMEDGWKVRLNADSEMNAKSKAEQMNRFGYKAVSAVQCEDVKVSQ